MFRHRYAEQCENVNGNQKDDSGPGTLLWLSSSPNASLKTQSTFLQRSGSVSYNIETAFEVRVRTQSLCVADETMNAIDAQASTADTADTMNAASHTNTTTSSTTTTAVNPMVSVWTTKEAGACVLSALLLKLTPLTIDAKKIE